MALPNQVNLINIIFTVPMEVNV